MRLGVQHLSRRRVAVKIMEPAAAAAAAAAAGSAANAAAEGGEAGRLSREIRVLKRLAGHPGIVRLLEVVEVAGRLCLVMEYAPGGSLLDYVRAKRRLPESEAAHLLQQMVAALEHCHEHEVCVMPG